MGDKPVFSTDANQAIERKPKSGKGWEVHPGPCRYRLEKKGRGGKTVTVLYDLPFSKGDAKKLMKNLQSLAGVGATIKDGSIELQGDQSQIVEQHFAKMNQKLVKSGS